MTEWRFANFTLRFPESGS